MKKPAAEAACRSMLMIWLGAGSLVASVEANAPGRGHDLRFQRALEGSEAIKKNTSVLAFITQDQTGFVWFGGENGSARLYGGQSKRYGQEDPPEALPSNDMRDLAIDAQGAIWVAGDRGLCCYLPQTGNFENFRSNHGVANTLPHNVVASIAVDRYNNLVLGTGSGISILQRATSHADEIWLRHDHSMFSFDFSALTYHSPYEHRYAYKLAGFDNQWHEPGANYTATYTNTAPGDHVFKVKSSDRDGGWNPNPVQVKLSIAPSSWSSGLAPWSSGLAAGFYALVLALIIAFLLRKVFKHLKFNYQSAFDTERSRSNETEVAFLRESLNELAEYSRIIIGLAEAILREQQGRLPDNTEQRVAFIANHGECLPKLIDCILNDGTLSGHELELNTEPTDLFMQAQFCLQLLQPFTRDRHVELVNAIVPDGSWVTADPKRLNQILVILLTELIKHAQQGEVRVTAKAAHGRLSVEVSASGYGIDADVGGEALKTPTRRTLGEQALPVTAGLAMAKHLVELHGSNIDFDMDVEQQGAAQTNKTALFRFTLPMAGCQTSTDMQTREKWVMAEQASAPFAQRSSNHQAKMVGELAPPVNAEQWCILVVDDDPVNRMVLNGILSLHNYTVLEAGSGPEALNIVLHEAQAVDLIILDVMMPRMSGFEVCAHLRQQYRQEALPILFLTAKYGEEDVRKGLQAGGDEVLHKPVSKEVLLPKVTDYLLALARHREGL